MATRREQTRILKATKIQVASQLQSIHPGITGPDIIDVGRAQDQTFWYAKLSTGFLPFNGITQSIDTYVEFDSQFLVTNLLAAVDNTITAADILALRISPTDSLSIEVELIRKRL